MTKIDMPVTPGVRLLRERGITFTPRLYAYEEKGGTTHSAAELGVPEHEIVKTLVFETDTKRVVLVLMHGDREVSSKQLARILGVRSIVPCDSTTAQKNTGYQFGGTSPFGTRQSLPVYVERTILDLPIIHINGGKRGFLVTMSPGDLEKAVHMTPVEVAIDKG
jgi:Cys-tRNA(Pro) deacylase